MGRPTLLVVDDDHNTCEALSACLRLHVNQVKVQTAGNGKAALIKVLGEDFDVIVTDLIMPEMPGFTFLAALKLLCPGIPTIVMSGHRIVLEEALKRGAYAALPKPIKREELLTTVAGAIQHRRSLMRRS